MEEFVINEEKIEEDLKHIDAVCGLSEGDRKIARGDLIAGIDRAVIERYLKKNFSHNRKRFISSLLRAGAHESVVAKYTDKSINEDKLKKAVRYIDEGVPPLYVDLHFNDPAFSRLLDYWLWEQNKLRLEKEKDVAEKKEASDGLIKSEETQTENESKEIEDFKKTVDSDDSAKDDFDVVAEAVTEEPVKKVEENENKAPKDDDCINLETAVPQNTVINGFTFEQVMELFTYMNNNSNYNVQKMHNAARAEEKPETVVQSCEPVKSTEVKQSDVLTEEKIQAIVSAAMKQTIEEAKKQTLEEISKQHEAEAEKAEKDPVDIYIDDIRKEISELRREADENKKTENALRNELEEKNKETADRMNDYFERFKALQVKTEEKDTVETQEESAASSLSLSGYMVPLKDTNGNIVGNMPVEIERRRSNGIGGLFGLLGFKKKSQQSLVRMVISGELNKDQLSHIVGAMKKGLSEGQLTDLIESKVPAEKMPEIIEIAMLEKSMGYAY